MAKGKCKSCGNQSNDLYYARCPACRSDDGKRKHLPEVDATSSERMHEKIQEIDRLKADIVLLQKAIVEKKGALHELGEELAEIVTEGIDEEA